MRRHEARPAQTEQKPLPFETVGQAILFFREVGEIVLRSSAVGSAGPDLTLETVRVSARFIFSIWVA